MNRQKLISLARRLHDQREILDANGDPVWISDVVDAAHLPHEMVRSWVDEAIAADEKTAGDIVPGIYGKQAAAYFSEGSMGGAVIYAVRAGGETLRRRIARETLRFLEH